MFVGQLYVGNQLMETVVVNSANTDDAYRKLSLYAVKQSISKNQHMFGVMIDTNEMEII
jgi:hypothetical protein